MKIIDTVALIGYIDPFDIRNERAAEFISQLQEDELMVASASLKRFVKFSHPEIFPYYITCKSNQAFLRFHPFIMIAK